MNDLDTLPGKAQKQLFVIPIIDRSGSMSAHGNIGKVNDAMKEVAPQLVEIEQSNNVSIRLAPISFASGASWLGLNSEGQPVGPSDFKWTDMIASGGTDLGAAFKLLNSKLTRTENGGWLEGRKGLRPVILLISDGEPNDDWENPLKDLSKRGWFKVASKFAIAVEGADLSVLERFTGNKEAIYNTDTLRTDLGTLVKAIVLAASMAVSDAGGAPMDTASVDNNNITDANEAEQQNILNTVNETLGVNDNNQFFDENN